MKYKKGFKIGIIVGFFVVLSVYLLYSYTDCFSCGFLGIDYCSGYEGICPLAGGYMDFIRLVSIPFVIFGLLVLQFFPWLGIGIPKLFAFLSPLYLLYSGFLGFFIQKLLSVSRK
mgnify:CR=1